MKEIMVKTSSDQPICTRAAGWIKAPAPIAVVAAIAPSPPKNNRRVPTVSMASRKDAPLNVLIAIMNGIKIYSLLNHAFEEGILIH
jgi:hypothetical protein